MSVPFDGGALPSLGQMRRPTSRQLAISVALSVVVAVLALTWDEIDPAWRALIAGIAVLGGLLGLFSRQSKPVESSNRNPLPEILERVVADETRRPWNPTTLPWLPSGDAKPALLVPAADYHLAEIVPLARELEKRGIPTRIAIGESPWGRAWQGIHWYEGLDVHALPDPDTVARDASLVVAMKDTGSMTDWVTQVRQHGVPVVGKVEGAQDFWDSDTPEERRPYRNLDLVLCQGQFDADALADRDTAIVGSTRLERLWWAPPVVPREPLALINLNFVYGVRTADRDLWLETAIAGCAEAGVPYVVSIHPAERSQLRTDRVTRISASRLLPHASVLISRFSTLPFEAMARGVPFIYHNPHGETVKTFADSSGAFPATTNEVALRDAIFDLPNTGVEARKKAREFFRRVVDIGSSPSETRSVEEVKNLLSG